MARRVAPVVAPGHSDQAPLLVKSAQRTVQILETLAASPTRLTISKLQELTHVPRSSLHALMRTLRDLRWVEIDDAGTTFGIGPRALLAGAACLDNDPAIPFAVHALENLGTELGYTVQYARRVGAYVVDLVSRDALESTRTAPRPDRRLPGSLTAPGRALLAQLTREEVDSLLSTEFGPHPSATGLDRDMLHDDLDQIRIRGWAVDQDHDSPYVARVAAVVEYRIPATDAISCSIPGQHANHEELERAGEALRRHTRTLAIALRRKGIR